MTSDGVGRPRPLARRRRRIPRGGGDGGGGGGLFRNDDNGAAEPRDNDDDDDDFDIGFLVADDDDHGGGQVEDGRPGDPDAVAPASLTGCEYGCEVLAFGCADHCAMGVPGARGGAGMAGAGGGGPMTGGLSPSLRCHTPRQVEIFGLGDMRRTWSSSRRPTAWGTTAAAVQTEE